MTKSQVMVNLYGQMVDHMKGNGLTVNNMEKENTLLRMGQKNGVPGLREREKNGLMLLIPKNDD